MLRREFVALIAAFAALPLGAHAQQAAPLPRRRTVRPSIHNTAPSVTMTPTLVRQA
jgi:hypothetical protein